MAKLRGSPVSISMLSLCIFPQVQGNQCHSEGLVFRAYAVTVVDLPLASVAISCKAVSYAARASAFRQTVRVFALLYLRSVYVWSLTRPTSYIAFMGSI